MSHHNNDQVQRLRKWLLALVVIIVFAAGAAPLGVITFLEHRVDEAQFDIDCASAKYNVQQLQAIAELFERFGIPRDFTIAPVPEECPR